MKANQTIGDVQLSVSLSVNAVLEDMMTQNTKIIINGFDEKQTHSGRIGMDTDV